MLAPGIQADHALAARIVSLSRDGRVAMLELVVKQGATRCPILCAKKNQKRRKNSQDLIMVQRLNLVGEGRFSHPIEGMQERPLIRMQFPQLGPQRAPLEAQRTPTGARAQAHERVVQERATVERSGHPEALYRLTVIVQAAQLHHVRAALHVRSAFVGGTLANARRSYVASRTRLLPTEHRRSVPDERMIRNLPGARRSTRLTSWFHVAQASTCKSSHSAAGAHAARAVYSCSLVIRQMFLKWRLNIRGPTV